MNRLTDFRTTINGWTNISVADTVVDSWVRMAEERINMDLRDKDLIRRATTVLSDSSADLPSDWLELIYVRYLKKDGTDNINMRYGMPFNFRSNDEYWKILDNIDHPDRMKAIYTIIGNTLMVSPHITSDGDAIEIGYYGKIVPISDAMLDQDAIFFDNNLRLYTFATLALSAPYLVEDERVMVWESEATRLIGMKNDASKRSQSSGSPLQARKRSFG